VMDTRLSFFILCCGSTLLFCGGCDSNPPLHVQETPNIELLTTPTLARAVPSLRTPTVTKPFTHGPCPTGIKGGLIVFSSTRDDKKPFDCIHCDSEIYVTDTAGSSVGRLTFDPGEDRDPTWSPDGTRIVFMSDREEGKSQIYVMDCDGSNVIRLTAGPNTAESPAWSSDGTQIAYIQTELMADCNPSVGCPQDIYFMDTDGSHKFRMTNTETNKSGLAWSPDGKSILYSSYVEGASKDGVILYLFSIDGTDVRPLTSEFEWVFSFDWSPDGKRIAFDSYQYPIQQIGITLMDIDGANVIRINNEPPDTGKSYPAWSPDGSKIAYVSYWIGGNGISIMEPDGSNNISLPQEPGILRHVDWKL
jgi:Tol biopolymer transport system component